MQMRYSFIHMKSSEALIDYASSKIIPKIERFSTKPIELHLTFFVEQHNQTVRCAVKGGDGLNFEVVASCDDMYGSVDLLVDKLQMQMRRKKEKLKRHKSIGNLKNLTPLEPVSKDYCDSVPVDATDLIKYEHSRIRAFG